jgi:hypothetical protein
VKKLIIMALTLAVLAMFSLGCGGAQLCSTCGVDKPLTEEMIRYNKETGAGGGM